MLRIKLIKQLLKTNRILSQILSLGSFLLVGVDVVAGKLAPSMLKIFKIKIFVENFFSVSVQYKFTL